MVQRVQTLDRHGHCWWHHPPAHGPWDLELQCHAAQSQAWPPQVAAGFQTDIFDRLTIFHAHGYWPDLKICVCRFNSMMFLSCKVEANNNHEETVRGHLKENQHVLLHDRWALQKTEPNQTPDHQQLCWRFWVHETCLLASIVEACNLFCNSCCCPD